MALVGAAGPLSNLAMALIFTFLIKLFYLLTPFIPAASPEWLPTALGYLYTILYLGVFYNLAFMVFNLLPVPPLDGSRILYAFLPSKALLWVQKYEQYFFWGVLGLFLVCNIFNISIIGWIVDLLMTLLFKLFFIA